ncbi:MAG: sugar ABC transporter ATP-binding protein [Geminicoccaceae bacterium]|nr:sugar ABC transporter ATP-binding protein [Geminicoccaceae bacterium]MCB9968025.1 sugar ABC transporter ATP-binding protein [Geminicoccaceae bacterium]HRY23741.1 ATP-binding cassette domain-containing protein [Geminicoccaceae bacterium]
MTSGRADGAGSAVLQLEGISKRFGAVEALSEVDFEVRAAEVVALAGDNGAGKSTLVKVIAGTHAPDGGVIRFDGVEVSIRSPRHAASLGIETVYQDLALCDNLDVVANMYLGRETVGRPRFLQRLSELDMERHALDVLRRLNVTTIRSVRAAVATLSGGQRQSVAISRAVMWNSKIVLLDEPTAALGVAQTHEVLELIKRLRAQGLGVVLISHNLHDMFEVADRIVVLRLGRNAAAFRCRETTPEEVVAAITGAREAAAREAVC